MSHKWSPEKIFEILNKAKNAKFPNVSHMCETHGISTASFYRWKKRYGNMSADDIKNKMLNKIGKKKSSVQPSSLTDAVFQFDLTHFKKTQGGVSFAIRQTFASFGYPLNAPLSESKSLVVSFKNFRQQLSDILSKALTDNPNENNANKKGHIEISILLEWINKQLRWLKIEYWLGKANGEPRLTLRLRDHNQWLNEKRKWEKRKKVQPSLQERIRLAIGIDLVKQFNEGNWIKNNSSQNNTHILSAFEIQKTTQRLVPEKALISKLWDIEQETDYNLRNTKQFTPTTKESVQKILNSYGYYCLPNNDDEARVAVEGVRNELRNNINMAKNSTRLDGALYSDRTRIEIKKIIMCINKKVKDLGIHYRRDRTKQNKLSLWFSKEVKKMTRNPLTLEDGLRLAVCDNLIEIINAQRWERLGCCFHCQKIFDCKKGSRTCGDDRCIQGAYRSHLHI